MRRKRRDEQPAPVAPRRFGIALGGGFVRGAAHLGVLSVLEREGIRPDVVAGTSVGAIVGAGLAAGIPCEELYEVFRKSSWLRIAVPAWKSKLSLLDASPLGALVEKVTGVTTFEELATPLAVVACDLLTGERVVLRSGPLRPAIIASAAVPALFEPVRLDGMMLVDGGLVENVPTRTARESGADYVLGVDVMSPTDSKGTEPAELRDVIMMSWDILQRDRSVQVDGPGTTIAPKVGALSLSDFSTSQEAFDAGVAAMEAALPRLRLDLGLGLEPRGGSPVRPVVSLDHPA